MNSQEARAFLALHRAGEQLDDPRFAAAEEQAAADPELARWWAEEQEFDRAIAAGLAAVPVPEELKARLSSRQIVSFLPYRGWQRGLLLAAAMIIALAVLFGSWEGPFQSAVSLADYRDEMISFIKMTPPLELETKDLTKVEAYLKTADAPLPFAIPEPLQALEPIGCRVLRFRGENVSLICFKRSGDRLIHLFILPRSVLRQFSGSEERTFAPEEAWMTATWIEREQIYLLAVQGDRADTEKFLSRD